MPRYLVTMPITGTVCKEVEAESEDAAIDNFFELWGDDPSDEDSTEWEFVEHVTTGNVFHGVQNDVCVDLLE
jgi:hypothetical protein